MCSPWFALYLVKINLSRKKKLKTSKHLEQTVVDRQEEVHLILHVPYSHLTLSGLNFVACLKTLN